MNFISINFAVLLFICFILNYKCNKKYRVILIFVANLIFYSSYSFGFTAMLLIIGLFAYIGAFILEKNKNKYIYVAFFLVLISPLLLFKYTNFFIETLNRVFSLMGTPTLTGSINILQPLGISFFTFKVITYIGDVYHKKLDAEHSYFKVMAYIMFFPQIASGPIQKARDFLPQLSKAVVFNYERVVHGMYLIAFGLLQKLVISDTLGVIVNKMLANISGYAGFHYIFFALCYSIYIYVNFNSYSDMAIGIGEVLGFECKPNFRMPYLSRDTKEFWRRWHITLSDWLTEYVYIPLGGSRKGVIRQYSNIMIVFLVSGLWHGPSFHFIAWGALNGAYQIIGSITKKFRDNLYVKMKISQDTVGVIFLQRIITFSLIATTWIFFAIPSTRLSIKVILSMLKPPVSTLFDGVVLGLLGTNKDILFLVISLGLFFMIQIKRNKSNISLKFRKENMISRYLVYTIIVCTIIYLYCSSLGGTITNQFIYFDF